MKFQIDGCPVPIYQDEGEFNHLLDLVKSNQPKRILEIGSLYGGTLWYWMNASKGAEILSVDIGIPNYADVEYARLNLWNKWADATGCILNQIRNDSRKAEIIEMVKGRSPFDFIFIDGDHSANAAMTDWQNYWPMLRTGGFLAFHDIAYPDINHEGVGVGIVWREVRNNGKWQEFIREPNPKQTMGIGVMWKE
jgi:predicted O-methyltransferase YrrM